MWVTVTVVTSPIRVVSRGHDGRDEQRVEPPADLVSPLGGLAGPVRLLRERVVDGDEVEQPALGGADQVGPVARGEQLAEPGGRLVPCRGVPVDAVERDGQV